MGEEIKWHKDKKKKPLSANLKPLQCEKCGARLFDVDMDVLKLALGNLPMYYRGRDIVDIQCYKRDCKHHNKITV